MREESSESRSARQKEGAMALDEAAVHLRNALMWLEREKGVVVNGWGGEEVGMSEQVNEYWLA